MSNIYKISFQIILSLNHVIFFLIFKVTPNIEFNK